MKERRKERNEEGCKETDASICIAEGCVGSTAGNVYLSVFAIIAASKVRAYGGMEAMLPHS
jgi:hypothetical protein